MKRILFITDPWKTLDHTQDTTLVLMQEMLKLKTEIFWCDHLSVGTRSLRAQRLRSVMANRSATGFGFSDPQTFQHSDFDQIHYRKDPPVDAEYKRPLKRLHRVSARIINRADWLLGQSEKTVAALLPEFYPATCVSSSLSAHTQFAQKRFLQTQITKKTILKPLYGAQSIGVQVLDWSRPLSCKKKIHSMIQKFKGPILQQEFLPGIAQGEQRLWFLRSQLIGAIRKIPKKGESIINMDQGASVQKTVLTPTEKRAAQAISRLLKVNKIHLAAVDLIDGKITDFNFTSPGLIVEIQKILKKNLAKQIAQVLLRL